MIIVTVEFMAETKQYSSPKKWGTNGSWFYLVDASGVMQYWPERIIRSVKVAAAPGTSATWQVHAGGDCAPA